MCKCVWEGLLDQGLPLIEHLLVGQKGEVGAARRAAITHEPPPPPRPPAAKGSVVQIAAPQASDLLYLCDGSVYVLISGGKTSLAHLLLLR